MARKKYHGKQKLIQFTSATDMYTIEYEDGARERVHQNTRKLTRKQKRRAVRNAGTFKPARPR